jgi:hypothetical protein
MTAKQLFSISSIFFLVYGIGGLLLPSTFVSLFGFTANPALILVARFGASESVVIAVILLLGRNLTDWPSLLPIVAGTFLAYALGVVTTLAGMASGVMGPLGWVSVITNTAFAIAFGYLLFVKKAA